MAPKRRGGTRSAARNLGWLLSSKGLGALLSLAYLAIATRTLGTTDFGRFVLITGASQALITFVGFPTWQLVIQYGVTHLLSGDEAALGRLFRASALLDLGAAALGSVIVVLLLALFTGAFGIGHDLVGYVAGFAIVQLLTVRSTPLGMLRLRDQYKRAAWADSVTPIVRVVGAVLAWAVAPTIAGFLIVWAIAELATAAAFWSFAAGSGDLARMWAARYDRAVVARENPRFLRFAFSTNANVAISLSEKQLPLLLVGAYVGPAAAGAFRLAFQLAQALSKLAQILTRAAFPELVHAVRRKPAEKLNALLVKILLASTAAALVILLIVIAIGGDILALVGGKAYAPAYPILIWLAAAGCLDLATVGFEPVLMALHRAGSAFLVRLGSAAIILLATLVLTPRFGALGAAMALLAGSLVTETLLALLTFRAVAKMPPGTRLDIAEGADAAEPALSAGEA
jgi:O-antigen/teichoic acid export membrane protein